ncbi:MAG: hypothetical protein IJH75_06105 [Mogibacterium sp.]|nr:hypothetical protein [Mogibacterium sp.]
MKDFKENLLIAVIVLIGVVTYFGLPYFLAFVARVGRGSRGALYFLVAGVILVFLFYLMGYRTPGEIVKVALIVAFLMGCVWLYINLSDVTAFLDGRLGVGLSTLLLGAIALVIWLITKIFL